MDLSKAIRSLVLISMILYGTNVHGQSHMTTGVIEGNVFDEAGGAIPGAAIRLKHLGIGISRMVKTDDHGRYLASLLPVGNYEITAQANGFTTERFRA